MRNHSLTQSARIQSPRPAIFFEAILEGRLLALNLENLSKYIGAELRLDASPQPRAAIHFETATRQGLLHNQIGHWPRRSAPGSVVTGPDLTQRSS
jgi:hypothetical protein